MAAKDAAQIFTSPEELKHAIAAYVKAIEEPVGQNEDGRQDSFSNRVWTLNREGTHHWNLNKMFTFTDKVFEQLTWTGFVTPQPTFTEMLVDVSVQGNEVLFMLHQIISTTRGSAAF